MNRNQALLQQSQEKILLTNGRIASQTGVLQLKQNELFRLFPSVREEVRQLQIRPRRVQTVSTVAFGVQQRIFAQLRDSIAIAAKGTMATRMPPDTLQFRVFNYRDAYYDVSGYALGDRQVLHISSRDTMTQVVFRRRKHRWLWIFSRKTLEQRVYFKNPDAHIYYSQTIQVDR